MTVFTGGPLLLGVAASRPPGRRGRAGRAGAAAPRTVLIAGPRRRTPLIPARRLQGDGPRSPSSPVSVDEPSPAASAFWPLASFLFSP